MFTAAKIAIKNMINHSVRLPQRILVTGNRSTIRTQEFNITNAGDVKKVEKNNNKKVHKQSSNMSEFD